MCVCFQSMNKKLYIALDLSSESDIFESMRPFSQKTFSHFVILLLSGSPAFEIENMGFERICFRFVYFSMQFTFFCIPRLFLGVSQFTKKMYFNQEFT